MKQGKKLTYLQKKKLTKKGKNPKDFVLIYENDVPVLVNKEDGEKIY